MYIIACSPVVASDQFHLHTFMHLFMSHSAAFPCFRDLVCSSFVLLPGVLLSDCYILGFLLGHLSTPSSCLPAIRLSLHLYI
jgi:hypothetical protein